MITHGLIKILELSSREINLFYEKIDEYFKQEILNNMSQLPLDSENSKEVLQALVSLQYKILPQLGFSKEEVESHFSSHLKSLWEGNSKEILENGVEVMKIYDILSPIIYKLFLDNVIKYLADTKSNSIMATLKSKEFLPIEFIIKLKELKKSFDKTSNKRSRLKKYLKIQDKILNKLIENKGNIEEFQKLEDPRDKLQLSYITFRIIEFFSMEKTFDFSNIKHYLKENIDEWLDTIPLVSLKNPDLYYCGIYLINKLSISVDLNKVKYFLLNIYDEYIDEFEAPLIEATNQVFFFFKSSWMVNLELSNRQNKELLKGDRVYYQSSYLKNLETSQLVLILKVYNHLHLFDKLEQEKIKSIVNEIGRRVSDDGIRQFRDGFISAEATYHVLFYKYMRNKLSGVRTHKLLDKIISRIHRNLQLIDFSKEMNYDLLTELYYACESLQLLNCIENEAMIELLAKHLFPKEIIKRFQSMKENGLSHTSKLCNLKVSKENGNLIHLIK